MSVWIFSNHALGYYKDDDWDTATILKRKQYYFAVRDRNRQNVAVGDRVVLRAFGSGFWGTCTVAGPWVEDPEGPNKHKQPTGWFAIADVKQWNLTLPYEIMRPELSNKNHRLRICSATEQDEAAIQLGRRLYDRLGYGAGDGEFFLLESGIEEAVKANLKQLKLRLADESIQQQCVLDIGAGRTDLICLDQQDNYVILELKAVASSAEVVGQILRYIGYAREHFADKEGKQVRGVILAPSYDESLRLAAKAAGIEVRRIRFG